MDVLRAGWMDVWKEGCMGTHRLPAGRQPHILRPPFRATRSAVRPIPPSPLRLRIRPIPRCTLLLLPRTPLPTPRRLHPPVRRRLVDDSLPPRGLGRGLPVRRLGRDWRVPYTCWLRCRALDRRTHVRSFVRSLVRRTLERRSLVRRTRVLVRSMPPPVRARPTTLHYPAQVSYRGVDGDSSRQVWVPVRKFTKASVVPEQACVTLLTSRAGERHGSITRVLLRHPNIKSKPCTSGVPGKEVVVKIVNSSVSQVSGSREVSKR